MANNRLEVEDSEQRLDRISMSSFYPRNPNVPLKEPRTFPDGLLATLDSSSSHRGAPQTSNNLLLAQPSSEIDGPQTAQLLARVQAFLPQLQAANQEIESVARENPSSVDIESFNGTEQSYIQLSLGLGLFEQQGTQPANIDTSSSSSESGTSSEDDGSSSTTSTSSEEGDDASSDEDDLQPDLISLVTGIRPMLPLPKSRRRRQRTTEAHPGIMELDSSDAVAGSDQVDE